jgi:hypothetical protein
VPAGVQVRRLDVIGIDTGIPMLMEEGSHVQLLALGGRRQQAPSLPAYQVSSKSALGVRFN